MLRVLSAYGRNDLKNVRRDSLLLSVLVIPWLLVLSVRLLIPAVAAWLAARYSFDVVPYYPLILSVFFMVNVPLLFGVIIGFLVLDERDDDTLTALRVAPISMRAFAWYRAGIGMLFSVLYIVVCMPLTGLLPWSKLFILVPAALLASMFAPVVGLFLAAFASNKVEGLALTKGVGALVVAPVAAYFVAPPWQWLFGLVPTYWPVKLFWQGLSGASWWPFLLGGVAYHLVLIIWLMRRFQARVL